MRIGWAWAWWWFSGPLPTTKSSREGRSIPTPTADFTLLGGWREGGAMFGIELVPVVGVEGSDDACSGCGGLGTTAVVFSFFCC